jgi:hypothetical protein
LIPGRGRDFSLCHRIQTIRGAHPVPYPVGTRVLSTELKQPGHEADHAPPSSAEGKNGGAIPPVPHTPSWRGAKLIKHRGNFTFTFNITSYLFFNILSTKFIKLTHNEEVMSVFMFIHLLYVQNYLIEFIEITVLVRILLGNYRTYHSSGN